jgi:hypothetical protein
MRALVTMPRSAILSANGSVNVANRPNYADHAFKRSRNASISVSVL